MRHPKCTANSKDCSRAHGMRRRWQMCMRANDLKARTLPGPRVLWVEPVRQAARPQRGKGCSRESCTGRRNENGIYQSRFDKVAESRENATRSPVVLRRDRQVQKRADGPSASSKASSNLSSATANFYEMKAESGRLLGAKGWSSSGKIRPLFAQRVNTPEGSRLTRQQLCRF